ncbi:MAG: hypothetical protein GQ531_04465 [Sulfurovum sp.]|nr:hypothetical protein [Sulfurovum sp.]
MQAQNETGSRTISARQAIFSKYLTFTLVDLMVLNFFPEYWDKVTITSFGVSPFCSDYFTSTTKNDLTP